MKIFKIIFWILFISFVLHFSMVIFIGYMIEKRKMDLEETKINEASEYLDLVVDMLEKDYNLILNKEGYIVEYVSIPGGYFIEPNSYIMRKKI